MGDQKPIVEVLEAAKRFGRKTALSDVTLTVDAGEVIGIVGPNGGGKSTLLLLMAGLLAPTSGSVAVCGMPAHRVALESAGLVGLVMARPGLYPLLTAWENLEYFAGLFTLQSHDVRQRGAALAETFGLSEHMDERLSTWSTGMQQKLSLIRALLLSPKLLLFDEPTANLDPVASSTLYGEVRRRADDGLGCVLVTHHLEAAAAVCDRVLIVDGTIREELRFSGSHALPDNPILDRWREVVQ